MTEQKFKEIINYIKKRIKDKKMENTKKLNLQYI